MPRTPVTQQRAQTRTVVSHYRRHTLTYFDNLFDHTTQETAYMPAYIHLVRDHGPHLLLPYPSEKLAIRALNHSLFIADLISEDCIDDEIIADQARLDEVRADHETETIIPFECEDTP